MKKKAAVVLVSMVAVAYFSFSVWLSGVDMYVHPPERYVGAYYYAWYNSEYWNNTGELVCYPSLGQYDSGDETVLRQHLEWADYAGLDFLAVSWWSSIHTCTIENTMKLFSIVSDYDVELAVMIEAYPETVPDKTKLQEYADYVFDTYVWLDGYFRLYTEPLLIIYDPVQFLTEFEDERFITRNVASHTPYLSETGKAWQNYVGDFITIYPGYDDTALGRENSWLQNRDGGGFYRTQWGNAVALSRTFTLKTLVCMVTSFNEIPEGSFIECSPCWGMLYLDITREYARMFRENFQITPK